MLYVTSLNLFFVAVLLLLLLLSLLGNEELRVLHHVTTLLNKIN